MAERDLLLRTLPALPAIVLAHLASKGQTGNSSEIRRSCRLFPHLKVHGRPARQSKSAPKKKPLTPIPWPVGSAPRTQPHY